MFGKRSQHSKNPTKAKKSRIQSFRSGVEGDRCKLSSHLTLITLPEALELLPRRG